MTVTDLERGRRLLVELHVVLAVLPGVPVTLQRWLQLAHMHEVLVPLLSGRGKGGIRATGVYLKYHQWGLNLLSQAMASHRLELTQGQSMCHHWGWSLLKASQ